MTVRYSLSRRDVAIGYLYGLKYSSTFRRQMVLMATGIGAISVVRSYLQRGVLQRADLLIGAMWAVALLVIMPIWLALRAKTEERVLDIAPDGVRTSIGERSAVLPWSTIAFVHDARSFVVIARKNANAFFVPSRAFADDQARKRFVTDAETWSLQMRTGT
jgi:hypothetical protein